MSMPVMPIPGEAVFGSNRELSLRFDSIIQKSPIHRQNCLRIGIPDSRSAGVYRSMRLTQEGRVRFRARLQGAEAAHPK